MSQYPTTIRAILPALATRALNGQASDSEKSQLRELRVWDPEGRGKVLLPTPHHCAQWMGIPENVATQMLGPNKRCITVIDDVQCEPFEHWIQVPVDLRPPSDRLSVCRERHWCKKCAKQISLIGNGWHVTAATTLVEEVLLAATRGKQGHKVDCLDYSKHPAHECTTNCRQKIKLGDVRKLINVEMQKRQSNPTKVEEGFIDV